MTFLDQLTSMKYYNSVLVIEKENIRAPRAQKVGVNLNEIFTVESFM